MQTEYYDNLMEALEKELLLPKPDLSKIMKLVEDTGCPHLKKVVEDRILDVEKDKLKNIS